MIKFAFKNVYLESCATFFPTSEVTSSSLEARVAPLYERLGLPLGTLEKVSGIKTRYFWDRGYLPSQGATEVVKRAMQGLEFGAESLGAIISCSVTRDYFEPATACIVHRNLGMTETSLAFDISNACIGFSDGIIVAGNLIESGIIESAVVVSCETVTTLVENNIQLLNTDPNLKREDLLELLPTLTLGSGAAAFVLCNKRLAKSGHRILGGAARSATQHKDLCAGNADHSMTDRFNSAALMRTESSKIIGAAAEVGSRLWPETSEVLGWTSEDVSTIFCHQVGKQVNEAFYREIGLDVKKEFTIYRQYGNLVSAALPSALTLGAEQGKLSKGAKIVCTAFGSGLNAIFYGIEW